jgi:hypothetical protein
MAAALLYLHLRQWQNRLLSQARRLRRPQYLVGALLGLAYFVFFFLRPFNAPPPGTGASGLFTAAARPVLEFGAAAGALAIMLGSWFFPSARAALDFTEAEIAFLFPAPVSRRTLVHFRLLKTQAGLGFSALVMTVVTWRMVGSTDAWRLAVGWWLVMSTLEMHRQVAGFLRTRLLDRGLGNWTRRLVIVGLVALLAAVIRPAAEAAFAALPEETRGEPRAVISVIQQVFGTGPLAWLLWPFRWIVRPLAAVDTREFVLALLPALGLLGALYATAVRTAIAFEEASLERAEKRSRLVKAAQSGNWTLTGPCTGEARAPFPLRPAGWRWVALSWKNMISTRNLFNLRVLVPLLAAALPVGIILATTSRPGSTARMIGAMALGLAPMVSLTGPELARFDLRQDLPLADQLKTYPLRGWQLVLGEVLAPVLFLAVIQAALLVTGAALVPVPSGVTDPGIARGSAGLAALCFVLPVNLMIVLIHNASALLFPAWVRLGPAGAQGFEAIGQRMLLMLGQVLVLLVALLVPALFGGLVFFGLRWLAGWAIALPFAAGVAALILLGEGVLALLALGDRFERMDINE